MRVQGVDVSSRVLRSAVSPAAADRRGAIALIALALLTVIAATLGVLSEMRFDEWQQARRDEVRVQAEQWALSGLRRGLARLREDQEYTGETWEIPADAEAGRDAATVHLSLQTTAADGPVLVAECVMLFDDRAEVRSIKSMPVGSAMRTVGLATSGKEARGNRDRDVQRRLQVHTTVRNADPTPRPRGSRWW